MSIQVARSSISVGMAAAASRRIASAGTGSTNERASGPIRVMPCSRRIHRTKVRLQWSSHSRVREPWLLKSHGRPRASTVASSSIGA